MFVSSIEMPQKPASTRSYPFHDHHHRLSLSRRSTSCPWSEALRFSRPQSPISVNVAKMKPFADTRSKGKSELASGASDPIHSRMRRGPLNR
jgi:hypothetical protein